VLTGGDPAGAVRGEAAGGNQEVHVGMMVQGASPGVQDGQDTDAGAEELGVPGQGHEGVGRGVHQHGVQDPLVGAHDPVECRGQGEDEVEVTYGQEFLLSVAQPTSGVRTVAFGAGTVSAGVVGGMGVPAAVAPVHLPAQDLGATSGQIGHGAPVAGRDLLGIPLTVRRSMTDPTLPPGSRPRAAPVV